LESFSSFFVFLEFKEGFALVEHKLAFGQSTIWLEESSKGLFGGIERETLSEKLEFAVMLITDWSDISSN
jgi:hypothetical protein